MGNRYSDKKGGMRLWGLAKEFWCVALNRERGELLSVL